MLYGKQGVKTVWNARLFEVSKKIQCKNWDWTDTDFKTGSTRDLLSILFQSSGIDFEKTVELVVHLRRCPQSTPGKTEREDIHMVRKEKHERKKETERERERWFKDFWAVVRVPVMSVTGKVRHGQTRWTESTWGAESRWFIILWKLRAMRVGVLCDGSGTGVRVTSLKRQVEELMFNIVNGCVPKVEGEAEGMTSSGILSRRQVMLPCKSNKTPPPLCTELFLLFFLNLFLIFFHLWSLFRFDITHQGLGWWTGGLQRHRSCDTSLSIQRR